MADGEVQITFLDNPLAPEIFATDATGFFLHEGNVTITLETARINHVTSPGPVNRVVSGRVVLSLAAAQRLVVGLNGWLEAQGLGPSASIVGDGSRQ